MSSQLTSSSRKCRLPKPGTGFLLVRLTGWVFKIAGGLLKAGTTLVGALGSFEEKMAGFIALTILSVLFAFVLLGLGGVVLLGIGFAFGRWGTTNN